jgi:hypothetical protein
VSTLLKETLRREHGGNMMQQTGSQEREQEDIKYPSNEIAVSAEQGSLHHGNFARPTLVRKLHKTFSIPYVYDYITKLSIQQAEVIQSHENANVRNIGQGEAQHRKYRRLKLGGGQAYDHSND